MGRILCGGAGAKIQDSAKLCSSIVSESVAALMTGMQEKDIFS
ncbi:unnamed protein product, partial [Choristocarpus tenellus]